MIRISKDLVLQIEKHGERTYPEECCGVMLGFSGGGTQAVEAIVELENEQGENRQRRFFVTPKQYMHAERTAADRKMELLGFYHSHPDHPAAPSYFDREHALPWFAYVITSVVKGEAKDMTAWILNEARHFDEIEILVEETVTKE